MASLHSSASMYADNAMNTASHVNPYLESGFMISNIGQMAQPPRGIACIPPRILSLTSNSLQSVIQQIDKSNHEIVNMLTQQIGAMFNPLISNTNHSYQQLA